MGSHLRSIRHVWHEYTGGLYQFFLEETAMPLFSQNQVNYVPEMEWAMMKHSRKFITVVITSLEGKISEKLIFKYITPDEFYCHSFLYVSLKIS